MLILLVLLVSSGCTTTEPRSARSVETLGADNAVSTAHPLATRAGLAMLARGGAPIDAAIAAQMVLGLVEPQSSGIGGGSLIMLWDSASATLTSFDGLAAAPRAATADLRLDVDGTELPLATVRRSPRATGVPGTLPALKQAHERYGKLPWRELFEPAIDLAERGFPLAPYMHAVLSTRNAARTHPDMVPLYFGDNGRVLPVGSIVRNDAYARTMRRVAAHGPDGLYADGGAQRWIDAARGRHPPSLVVEDDLRGYQARERAPVCASFLQYRVCTAPPPSFGGLAVLQILQMVQSRADGPYDLRDQSFAHLYAEAGRLAQADRRRYVGDPDFVHVPTGELIDSGYLQQRSLGIDRDRVGDHPAPGRLPGTQSNLDSDPADQQPATSQISIVDAAGNAVSMTTTINLNFGARIMVDGYVLNNALINFSPRPQPGRSIANQMAPGKRPVSPMAPAIVFDASGQPVAIGGAAGGGYIVDYVARSLIDMLANGFTPAQALAAGHLSSARPGKLRLERDTAMQALAPALSAIGHDVEVVPMRSGLGFLKRGDRGWLGASDPRRDGSAEGF